MSILALRIRAVTLQLPFSICCKRSETLASPPSSSSLSPVSPMHAAFAPVVPALYLNGGRAKQKHDFPSRGQERSAA